MINDKNRRADTPTIIYSPFYALGDFNTLRLLLKYTTLPSHSHIRTYIQKLEGL